jgi:hypothetical protein
LNSSILSRVAGNVLLLIASGIGGIVGDSVGSNIGWLHNFILSTSLFSHGLEGGIVVVVVVVVVVVAMMARSRRPTPGVGT